MEARQKSLDDASGGDFQAAETRDLEWVEEIQPSGFAWGHLCGERWAVIGQRDGGQSILSGDFAGSMTPESSRGDTMARRARQTRDINRSIADC